ncbi:MAG: hypothetical protein QG629_204, partial [Patescibacteria group bacterium]|nr:hypothetical protein [Patescibacteria group bacterium]
MKILKYTGLSLLLLIMFVALQAFAVVPPARAAQLSLTVTNTGDNGGVNPAANAGTGTLRQAIIDANASATTAAAPHTISFNITGTGLHTINLAGQLPTINQPIVLDGLTQPGSSCGTLVPGVSATTNTPHALTVEVTSRNKTDINTLLVGAAAGGSTIRGLVINGANTISVYNLVVYSPNNTIECNYIGTAADGQTVVSRDGSGGLIYNQQASGLEVRNNLISGNGLQGIVSTDTSGTSARSSNVSIHNNLVGTDKTGMINVSNSNTSGTNGTGIYITLGNNTSIYQNVISGHTTAGVYFTHQASLAIRGNKIGTNLAGSAAIANGYGIQDGRYSTGTIVGGSTTNDRNIIAGNTGYGFVTSASGLATDTVQIAGNYFGLGADGTTAIPNQMYNVFTQSYDNAIIGGSNPGEGNVVVASASAGIAVNGGTGVQIKGNYVGITPANTLIPNASGVSINNTSDALVGGVGPNDRNIISGQNNVAAAPGLTFANTVNSSIYGNYIGVGVDGMSRKPNNYGVSLAGNNTGMKLGGSTAAERNIISGNTAINIRAVSSATWANNVISGNYIGLDKNGDVIPGAATSGIVATSLTGVRIGGTSAGERNIISGNTGSGITLLGNGGANVQVYGNVIGLKPDGTTVAANGSGILFSSVTAPTGSYKIGGASAGQGNVISGNTKGITLTSTVATSTYPIVVQGNLIGLALDGTMARGNTAMGVESSNSQYVTIGGVGTGEANTIRNNTTYGVHIHGTSSSISVRGNAIASNGKIGINLGTDEVTDNDTNLTDNDTGANGLQNFPRRTTLTKCDGTTTEVRTVLRSKPNTTFTVDFYANPSGRDPSGNGEGQVYDSSTSVTTGSTGYAIITPPTVTNLSMTATDPDGNTSEFSNERAVSITGCGVTNKTTNDPTPSMAGTVTLAGFTAGVSPTASTISIDGQDVTASIAGSTWTLADNTLITLADGTYDTALTIADPESTMAASYSKTGALTIETTQPTVSVARKAGQTNYTQTNSAWFTLTLSEDANDATLTASDINIGTTTGSISTFTKVDETHYEFEITGMTSGDTTTPSIATNAFTDTYGNTNKASTSATNTWVMYDVTAPLAFAVNVDTSGSYSIDSPRITWDTTDGESGIDHYTVSLDGGTFTTRSSPFTPTLSAASSHTVAVRAYDKAGNYSEKTVIYPPVVVITAPTTLSNSSITDTTIKIQGPIGMIITDVGISGAGSSGFVCNPTPSPTTQVTVTCSGGSIASSGTLTVTATSDSGVTTSNSQDYVIDTVSPSVTINQKSGQADPTSTDSATYRVIFSEPIDATTFTQSDVQLSGTTGTVTTFTKVDSRTWDVTVTGMTNGDTAVASLLAGAAKDPSGNATSVSTSTDNSITYDSSRPSVTINQKSGQADPTSTNSATFTIIFSEPVSGVVASGFSIAGSATATISSLTKLN